MRPVVKSNALRKSDASYRFYATQLARQIGEYCSFCEIPVRGSLAVEHAIAKSTQPQYEFAWGNLLFACGNCNSAKGTKVGSDDDANRWIWPTAIFYVANDGTRHALATAADRASHVCFEYPRDGNTAIVRVRSGLPGATQRRAERTLDGLLLGGPRTDDADPRTIHRTRARALARQLAEMFVPAPTNEMLKAEIIATARAVGFWSVWMTEFAYALRNAKVAPHYPHLEALFVKTFPGTDPSLDMTIY